MRTLTSATSLGGLSPPDNGEPKEAHRPPGGEETPRTHPSGAGRIAFRQRPLCRGTGNRNRPERDLEAANPNRRHQKTKAHTAKGANAADNTCSRKRDWPGSQGSPDRRLKPLRTFGRRHTARGIPRGPGLWRKSTRNASFLHFTSSETQPQHQSSLSRGAVVFTLQNALPRKSQVQQQEFIGEHAVQIGFERPWIVEGVDVLADASVAA